MKIRAVLCCTLAVGCFASHPRSVGPLEDAGARSFAEFDAGVDASAADAGFVQAPDAGRLPDAGVDAGEPAQPCIEGEGGVIERDVRATELSQVLALSGIREIHGKLRLVQLDADAAAALPSVLGCLERIEGDLEFGYAPQPMSLTWLARLRHVGGIRITYCDHLDDLKGLEFLSDVAGDVYLDNNPELNSLEALSNLTHVGGELFVGRSAVTSLHGLEKLSSVDGSLSVYGNDGIPDLEGLGSLVHVGGHFLVWGNREMTRFTGVESLRSVGGDVAINANFKLQDLSGLSTLSTVGGQFGMFNNPLLSRCLGEELATRLGRPCGWAGMECEGLCTCDGNLNDVTCASDTVAAP